MRLCNVITERARSERFFREFGVSDTIDGRFDLLALHAWFVVDALEARRQNEAARRLLHTIFVQFDEALRELGAGDIGMGRRMKKMASAFFGRLGAYRACSDGESLAAAIHRNLYRGRPEGVEPAGVIATYCATARTSVARSDLERGEVDFGPLPALAA